MPKETETIKIKIVRPCIARGKVVPKGTVLSMNVADARPYLRNGKAVPATVQQKEKE